MTLTCLFELFAAQNRRLRSDKTRRVYLIALKQFARATGITELSLIDLTDDNLMALEKFLIGRSPYTINERLGRIKTLWRFASARGLVQDSPTLGRLPVEEPYRRAWTVEQVRGLLKACESVAGEYAGVPRSLWWSAWNRLIWETGERCGAMRRLQFDWFEGPLLLVPASARKGEKSQVYRLSRLTIEAIERIREPERLLVFPFLQCESTFFLHYGRLLRAAGLPSGRKCKSQRMRRTHLTYWAIGGGDPTARAKHSSRSVTDTYYLDESLLEQPDPTKYLPEL